MNTPRRAQAYKYDISEVINHIRNVPPMLNGYLVDADTLVDIFILRSLNSFELCTVYPIPPVVTDPTVLAWFSNLEPAKQLLYRLVRVPPEHSGTEASFIRQGESIWLFYII